jgi:hypothetical protein
MQRVRKDDRLRITPDDIGPPPSPVVAVARKVAPVATAALIRREARQRPAGAHQKTFHVVLEDDQPLEVPEGERPRVPAFRDDELKPLVGLFAPEVQTVGAPAERPFGEHGKGGRNVLHSRRIGIRPKDRQGPSKIAPTNADTWHVNAGKLITFTAACRNGHNATYKYSARELRELLQTASLRFHCARCVATRAPTAAETVILTQRVLRAESEIT